MPAGAREASAGILLSALGVTMPPRATLEAGDLVTPTAFAGQTGVPASTVRVWIHRSERMIGRRVEPLGNLGRWPAYDWNDLAALEVAARAKGGLQAEAA
jgi:hypothetical protein